jgi:putative ABC transport system substrate-binding protein
MIRRTIGRLATLILAIIVVPLAADSRQPGEVPQVGFLMLGSPNPRSPFLEVFRQALHELGYIEGQNVVFEYRWAEGRLEQLPDLAAELVQRRVDVIVASATPAILAAKQATMTIPIVILSVGDPVEAGFVESLRQPGGNITGVTGPVTKVFMGKLLELLKEAVPGVTRVAVLIAPSNPYTPAYVSETEQIARILGMQLHLLEVTDPSSLEPAFATITTERANALLILPAIFFNMHERRIAELAVQSRLPAIFWRRSFAEVGGLMAYGPHFPDLWRRAAVLVGRILKGTKPTSLPVEQAMRFDLVINLKTAEALGLTIPPSLLFQATEVIR